MARIHQFYELVSAFFLINIGNRPITPWQFSRKLWQGNNYLFLSHLTFVGLLKPCFRSGSARLLKYLHSKMIINILKQNIALCKLKSYSLNCCNVGLKVKKGKEPPLEILITLSEVQKVIAKYDKYNIVWTETFAENDREITSVLFKPFDICR